MRANSALPELLTPSQRTIAADGGLGADGGANLAAPLDLTTDLSIEGFAMGVMVTTDQQGPAIEGFAMGAIIQTTDQTGPSIEGFAMGVIVQA